MNGSRKPANLLIPALAILLIVLVVGAIAVLAYQYQLINQAAPTPVPSGPVRVTRVVPGTNLTAAVYPTLPPAWTNTPAPTVTPTVPTATPSATETATIAPTFAPTDTPAPTATGPTPTRRPTRTPSPAPRESPTPSATIDLG